jgi:hypothetical protein
MSVDLIIGIAGFLATALVVAGMILIAPRGTESSERAPELADDAPVEPTPRLATVQPE